MGGKIKLLLVLLICSLQLSAQMHLVEVDSLSFAHFEADSLTFNASNGQLATFFHKMDNVIETGKGNINILHLGSSHVQAGTLSHTIRRNLLLSFPEFNARRGIIFPYSAANKCNNPSDYKVKRSREFKLIRNVYQEHITPLGVTGIAVYAQDSIAAITMSPSDPNLEFCTNRIVVLAESTDPKFAPWIRLDSSYYAPVIKDYELRRFVFEVPDFTDTFTVILPCDSGNRVTLTGILLDNDNPGITFHSIGVNGASLNDYLKCPYFSTDLELLQPDLVIFGIGINDANGPNFDTINFKNQYLKLIDNIKEVNPDCAFIFITNNDSYKKLSRRKYVANKNNLLARDVFYRLAGITEGGVWDQFDIMGGFQSMNQWKNYGYGQTDRIHFTVKGYTLLGNLFFNAFEEAYEKVKDEH